MKRRLTTLAVLCALVFTLCAGAQAFAINAPEMPESPTEDTQPVTHPDGWDASHSRYYKNNKYYTGLHKIKGYYYYFKKNGVVLKKKMKTLKVGKKRYTFYFGKKGAAYKAPANEWTQECKVYKIGKYYYGFDQYSHRVKGVWVSNTGKAWVFNKNGACNRKKTSKLRKLTKRGKREFLTRKKIRLVIGWPKKTAVSKNSCNFFDASWATYWDYTMRYPHVNIELTQNKVSGQYYMNGIFGRDK